MALGFIWLYAVGLPRPASLINRTYAQVFEPYGLNLGLTVPYDNIQVTGGRSTAGSILTVNVVKGGPNTPAGTQLVYPPINAPFDANRQYLQRLIDTAAIAYQLRDDTTSKIVMDLLAGVVVRDKQPAQFEMFVRAPADEMSDNLDQLREGLRRSERVSDYFGNKFATLGRGMVDYAEDTGWIYREATQKMEAAPTANTGAAATNQPATSPPATPPQKDNGRPFSPLQ